VFVEEGRYKSIYAESVSDLTTGMYDRGGRLLHGFRAERADFK
jgi:hypothetical protein